MRWLASLLLLAFCVALAPARAADACADAPGAAWTADDGGDDAALDLPDVARPALARPPVPDDAGRSMTPACRPPRVARDERERRPPRA